MKALLTAVADYKISAKSFSELKEPCVKNTCFESSLSLKEAKKKWDSAYIEYAFFLLKNEETSQEPFAQCIFCDVKYSTGQNGRYTTGIMSFCMFNQQNFIKPIYLIQNKFQLRKKLFRERKHVDAIY